MSFSYKELMAAIEEAEYVLIGIGEEWNDERMDGYRKLYQLIQDKNHFIVSTCTNGEINKCGCSFQVVEPCGGYEKLQCSVNCSKDLYEVPDDFEISPPLCPKCGNPLVFHNIYSPNYSEVGYLEKWKLYIEWLQKTVNHSLCVVELGVGMEFPSVIRWPFEKIVYFNNKAKLYRVHNSLSQISEEIKGKGYSRQENSVDFIKKLSYDC